LLLGSASAGTAGRAGSRHHGEPRNHHRVLNYTLHSIFVSTRRFCGQRVSFQLPDFRDLVAWSSDIRNQDFISVDKSPWLCVSGASSLMLSFIRTPPRVASSIAAEVLQLAEQGVDEPFGASTLPRGMASTRIEPSRCVGDWVAAAEIGLKEVIGTLVAEAKWLLEELQNRPFSKMLQKYIPTLKVRSHLTGKSILPPNEMLNLLDDAVKARNKVIHAGAYAPNRKEFEQMFDAICDFL
jgi:hypothetical protein